MIPCSCEWLYQSAARASLSLTSSRRWSSGSWHTPHHGLRSLHRISDTHLSPAACCICPSTSVHVLCLHSPTPRLKVSVMYACACFTEMKQHQYTSFLKVLQLDQMWPYTCMYSVCKMTHVGCPHCTHAVGTQCLSLRCIKLCTY